MVPLFVFYIHIVVAAYIFTRRWQEESAVEAFLAVGFMTLIFFVGWSVSTFLLKLVVNQEGLGRLFDRDAMSLVLLTLLETVLYSTYYRKKGRSSSPQKKIPPGNPPGRDVDDEAP